MHNTIYVMMAPVLVLPCTWYCYVIISDHNLICICQSQYSIEWVLSTQPNMLFTT